MQFGRKSVKYLGYIVDSLGVRPDPAKIAAVVNFPVPRSVTNVRQFVELTGWMRRFVPGHSSIARPLYGRMKKYAALVGREAEEVAFVKLKELLCKYPVLRNPDFARPFRVYTHASSIGTGAMCHSCTGV